VSGLDWATVVPGIQLAVGADVRLEITRYTTPCAKLSEQFKNGDFLRMSQKEHPGSSRVCARVLAAGVIRPGDAVRLLPQ
jgi:MOSC domain-containing protein YiiM